MILTEIKKKEPIMTVPYPSEAEMDYRQNGLVLPDQRRNLVLLLRDVHQKGFLDLEFLYQLKQKEALKRVEKEISDKLHNDEAINEQREFYYNFKRAFMGCLSL
jgi:hypothetical protein